MSGEDNTILCDTIRISKKTRSTILVSDTPYSQWITLNYFYTMLPKWVLHVYILMITFCKMKCCENFRLYVAAMQKFQSMILFIVNIYFFSGKMEYPL